MIGVYDYTVILTYLSLFSSVAGIIFAAGGHPFVGIICLMVSGFFDMFDGKVARTKKRTQFEKDFGIQIDSLADLIGFGVLPIVIGYSIGLTSWYYIILFCFYTLAAVIRLAHFNATEAEMQKTKEGRSLEFTGLPSTSVALIFPLLYAFKNSLNGCFMYVYAGLMLIIAILFIGKFKIIKKPKLRDMILMIVIGMIVLGYLLWIRR